MVPKPDYVVVLERPQNPVEDEISTTVPCCRGDDLMIGDLKQRWLYFAHELDRLRRVGPARHYLH